MVGVSGIEPPSSKYGHGLKVRCLTNRLHPHMAWVAGFEPANLGVKVLCFTRLAIPKCILKNQASKPLNSARTSEYVVAYSKFFIVWGSTTTCPRDLKSYTPKPISKECTATFHNPEPCIQTSIGCFPNI